MGCVTVRGEWNLSPLGRRVTEACPLGLRPCIEGILPANPLQPQRKPCGLDDGG